LKKVLDLGMGRYLSLLLFIGLAWGQSPCEGRYLELLNQIRSGDASNWTDSEREEWKWVNEECRNYERVIKDSLNAIKQEKILEQENILKQINKYRFFLDDMERLEYLGTDAEIVKKEINKLVDSFREECAFPITSSKIIPEVTKEVFTGEPNKIDSLKYIMYYEYYVENYGKDWAKSEAERLSIYTPTKTIIVSPEKKIAVNRINEIEERYTRGVEWSNIIEFCGVADHFAENDDDTNEKPMNFKPIPKQIEFLSSNECYFSIGLYGRRNPPSLKKVYTYRATYQIQEIDASDIYNKAVPLVVFSFKKKENLKAENYEDEDDDKIKISLPLRIVSGQTININKYQKTLIQIIDDFVSDSTYSQLDVIQKLFNELMRENEELDREKEKLKLKEEAIFYLREEGRMIIYEDFVRPVEPRNPNNRREGYHIYFKDYEGQRWHQNCNGWCTGGDYFDKLPDSEVKAELQAMKNYIKVTQKQATKSTILFVGGCSFLIYLLISLVI